MSDMNKYLEARRELDHVQALARELLPTFAAIIDSPGRYLTVEENVVEYSLRLALAWQMRCTQADLRLRRLHNAPRVV